MPLVRHVLHVAPPGVETGGSLDDIVIVPFDHVRDGNRLTSLTAADAGAERPGEPFPSAAGLARELQSRPGRRVHAWLASAADAKTAVDSCLGLVALVESSARTARRFSISWLIVSRHARRRGIGTALVDHAVRTAGTLGATHVFADTRADWPAARAFWNATAAR